METLNEQRECRQRLLECTTADRPRCQGSGQVMLGKKPAEFS
ncbi:hypothetical protein CSB88_2931 [Pseudomonas aeruginosa]|nr:hypothetical protein CSB88_2931 [Pseudomonas aeruginosa]